MSRLRTKRRRLPVALLGLGLLTTLGVVGWSVVLAQPEPDQPAVTVQFDSSAILVNEGSRSVTITVTLSAASSKTVTVDFATSDGTATGDANQGADGGDYVITSGTLTFLPGEVTKTIDVEIFSDFCCEANEKFSVSLANPTNANIGNPASVTVTIVDDDPCP